jgi:ornithine cyclodeaminase/alanine dehydrogenase-like protein (mu-crystallin family)
MRFTHATDSAPPRTKAFRRDPVAAVVRLPSEPCIYYPELIVHQTLMSGICAFMERLESFYRAWSEDAVTVRQPTKQIFQTAGIRGDWRVMPCAIAPRSPTAGRDTHGINAVKVIGTNEEQRMVQDKISVGKAMLMHPTDHFVEAIFDVAALSSFRTAAISVLAYKFCGHRRNHIAAIVGAGRIGFYTAVILQQWLGVTSLLINDKQRTRTEAFLQAIAAWFGRGARSADLADLRNDSQAIFLGSIGDFCG